ncbi:MAG: hypothetical protein JNJ81_03020 [Candidatus Accumulibacter sp.]|nr:hypothetical protein [Accumulibacter sp.]
MGLGFLATLTALVMGLTISTAKSSFDAKSQVVQNFAVQIVQLDSALRQVGSAADLIRDALQQSVNGLVDQVWTSGGSPAPGAGRQAIKRLQTMLHELPIADAARREDVLEAGKRIATLAQQNAMAFTVVGSYMIAPLLGAMVFWMMFVVAGWNLLAPRNTMVLAVDLVCAVSVGLAIFLMRDPVRVCDLRRSP